MLIFTTISNSIRNSIQYVLAAIAAALISAIIIWGIVIFSGWITSTHGNWYIHGEQLGSYANQYGFSNSEGTCHGALISGGIYMYSDEFVGGDTPPLTNLKADREWLAGCLHGFSVSNGDWQVNH